MAGQGAGCFQRQGPVAPVLGEIRERLDRAFGGGEIGDFKTFFDILLKILYKLITVLVKLNTCTYCNK